MKEIAAGISICEGFIGFMIKNIYIYIDVARIDIYTVFFFN